MDATQSVADRHGDTIAQQVAESWPTAPVTEEASVTAHSVVASGRVLRYHAAAGTLTIQDDDAKPTASVFYVAYTLGGAIPGSRPVTFL